MKRRKITIQTLVELARSHNGECLTDNYTNANAYIRWRCALGHVWEARAYSALQGHWCKLCSVARAAQRRRGTIQEMQELARTKNGKCLSKRYLGANRHLWWQCDKGHPRWRATPAQIRYRSWCPECGRDTMSSKLAHTISWFQEIAKKKGGICLSTSYENRRTLLTFRCKESHTWTTRAAGIQNGSWCPHCAGKCASIQDLQELARNREGECLSERYGGALKLHRWRCRAGHEFQMTPSSVRVGHWCHVCAGNRRKDLGEIAAEGTRRGWTLISTTYVRAGAPLQWRCQFSHEFQLSWNKVQRGRGCPSCSSFNGEAYTRAYFERIFRAKFPTKRPEWLRSRLGARLELDGYNEALGLAFEYQGLQHYEPSGHYSAVAVAEIKSKDRLKRRLCRGRGLKLLIVRDVVSSHGVTALPNEILRAAKIAGVRLPIDPTTIRLNLIEAMTGRRQRMFEKLLLIAERNGGQLLSPTYTSANVDYNFRCAAGHEFESTAARILYGKKFCPFCGTRRRCDAQVVRAALAGLGKLITKNVRSVRQTITIECLEKGHRFRDTFDYLGARIRMGMYFCPECNRA